MGRLETKTLDHPLPFGSGKLPALQVHRWTDQVIDMSDAQVATALQPNSPASSTLLTGNLLIVDPQSSGAGENLLLPPEADSDGAFLLIYNVGGEEVYVQDDAGGAIATVEPGGSGIFTCGGTTLTWRAASVVAGGSGQIYNTDLTTLADANVTLTIAQILDGAFEMTPTIARNATLPTAALIVAGIPGANVGDTFEFFLSNKAGGAFDITIQNGTGGTVEGDATIGDGRVGRVIIRLTNVTASTEAYVAYVLGESA